MLGTGEYARSGGGVGVSPTSESLVRNDKGCVFFPPTSPDETNWTSRSATFKGGSGNPDSGDFGDTSDSGDSSECSFEDDSSLVPLSASLELSELVVPSEIFPLK